MMSAFDALLKWRLLPGSHPFPGPDGGTCINEAAIVAAGFEYRAVMTVYDLPECFSLVIAGYAIRLNDGMPVRPRQRLMPFVPRLAGTADTFEVEAQRAEYLAMAACRRFAARSLDAAGMSAEAARCRAARTLDEAYAATRETIRTAARAADAAMAARSAVCASQGGSSWTASAAAEWAAAAAARPRAWSDALDVFDGVLSIGRQAYAPDIATVAERLERAKAARVSDATERRQSLETAFSDGS
jgi:hypothetical protein